MEYRNIDNDYKLYQSIKRYYEDQSFTKNQLFWILGNDGYSTEEIDRAIYDYYLVHIRTNTIVSYMMWCICVFLICYLAFALIT